MGITFIYHGGFLKVVSFKGFSILSTIYVDGYLYAIEHRHNCKYPARVINFQKGKRGFTFVYILFVYCSYFLICQ